MILNRPSNLWLGAATAILNAVVLIAAAAGVSLSPEGVAAVNVALGAIILLIAGRPPVVNTDSSVVVKVPNGVSDKRITFNDEGVATTANN